MSSRDTEIAQLARERDEALEQQTATAEVLQIISASPTELRPVLEVVVRSAARFCEADDVTIFELDGRDLRIAAHWGAVPQEIGVRFPCTRGSVAGRTIIDRKPVQVIDLQAEAEEFPEGSGFARRLGHRTTAGVPLLREGVAIGTIQLRRTDVNSFTNKQIALLGTFAAQAVIAIENARLLNELRESLDRQTATADILRVIAGTPEDSKHALDTIAETASRMFDTANVNFRRLEGDVLRIVSSAGPHVSKLRNVLPDIPLEPTDPAVRSVLDNRQIAVEDRLAALPNERGELARTLHDLALGGLPIRSQVFTPLLREGKAIGVMIVSRGEVRPFQEHELDLMRGFADQAVIAIENARLLSELRQRTADLSESLEQQTATSDVLKVISRSTFDLQMVLNTLTESASRLCAADRGVILMRDGDVYRVKASYGFSSEGVQYAPEIRPGPGSVTGRVALEGRAIHIHDVLADPEYEPSGYQKVFGFRTNLGVPLLRDGTTIGVFALNRDEVKPFTDKQIELVTTFADQAVIAIENARLLNELRQRTQEVVKLNQQLEQRVADQVGEIERMGRLRRFLPPQVADLIVASGTEKQLESHRREITALFCDLRGFTGFSESSDPEDVIALLRDYHAAIGQIIVKYSGTLERFAGDGVMVIFNDPVPVENPALQAVLMALDMRTAIGAMIEKWRDLGHDLGFGIGIAHGFATLGTIGFEGRFDYAAIGTVSNVASRLCDEAKPGQILISPRVRQAVDKAVTVEPVGEFTLKGIRRPMAAYNVLAATASKPN